MKRKHLVLTPATLTQTSAKSTSASCPGRCVCGTNPPITLARFLASSTISARRFATYFDTVR